MPINFTETRLELGYDYGVVGGLSFKTEIIEKGDGSEQRNALWYYPLGRWQLGQRRLLESDIEGIHQVEYLRQFHFSRKGSLEGFRFKDWCDYSVTNQYIGIGDGVETKWQLKKTYRAGSASSDRPIIKPVVGTVNIYVDGVNVAVDPNHDWTVSHEEGTIEKETLLESGKVVSVDFEFDLPVIFENDDISWELIGYEAETGQAIYELGSVFIKEIRVDVSKPLPIQPLPIQINEVLDLGIIYQTEETHFYQTDKQELVSGWTTNFSNYEKSKNRLNLGTKVFNKQELEELLGFFWNAKGKAVNFLIDRAFSLTLVRFDIDQLNIKFIGKDTEDSLFEVNGLNLLIHAENQLYLDRETYVKVYIDSSGSMDPVISTVEESVNQIKNILKQLVYLDDATTNKYYKGYQLLNNELWLNWLNTDLRNSPNEPNKQIFLLWINESNPSYHGIGTQTLTEPTALFNTHLTSFLNTYPNREKFKVIIYSPNSPGLENYVDRFNEHLLNAYNGTNGYTEALKDYGILIRLNVDPQSSYIYYLNDILFNI